MKYKLCANWTDDCSGKKDYDGEIVSIATRYWPAGGGFTFFDPKEADKGLQESKDKFPERKSSAHSSLILNVGGFPHHITLSEKEFEAETQEEVQKQVETWAQDQMDKLVSILRENYEFKAYD